MRLTLALSSCLCPGVQVFLAVGLYVVNVVFAAGKADCGAEPEVLGGPVARASLQLDFLRQVNAPSTLGRLLLPDV